MFKLNKAQERIRKWLGSLSSQEVLKARSNLSPNHLPTDSGLQQARRLGAILDRGPACPSSQVEVIRLYWMSFRAHDDSFLGVVIGRGTSPGKAASRVIDSLELPSNRASIVAIPVEREIDFEQYQGRLIGPEAATFLLKKLDIQAIER